MAGGFAGETAAGALSSGDRAALDGLRGLAALIVVASHAGAMGQHWVPGLSLVGIGKYGVYLFFVLSAFLLTLQWLQALQAGPLRHSGARTLAAYLVKRVMRIYPLYTVVLLAGWMLAPRGLGVPMDGAAVVRHLGLQEGRDLYWSVPVEFLFYLVIPPLALWLTAARLAPVARLLGVVALGAAVYVGWPAPQAPLNSIALGYYLPVFLAGSLAAWWWQRQGGLADVAGAARPARRAASWADVLPLALLVISVPSVFAAVGWDAGVDGLHRQFAAWGLFWAALLLAMLAGRLPLWHRLLGLRGLRACGHWCFGIYLLHIPALALAGKLPLPGFVKAALGLAGALLLAAVAHRLIERPAMRLGQALASRLAPDKGV